MEIKDWIPIGLAGISLIGFLVMMIWNASREDFKERVKRTENDLIAARSDFLAAMTAARVDFTKQGSDYALGMETRYLKWVRDQEDLNNRFSKWQLFSTEEHSKLWQALPANYVTKSDFDKAMDVLREYISDKVENLRLSLSKGE